VIGVGSRCLVGAAALAGVLAVTGCAPSSQVDTTGGPAAPAVTGPSTVATTATPTATALPEQAAILSQYRAFFAALTPLSKAPYRQRLSGMKKFAVDPELTRVMGGIAASQAAGEVGYGAMIIRPVVGRVSGGTATLTDCQDNSHSGRLKSATGEKVTVGRVNQLATVTMKRGADGTWRMATVVYSPEGSCHAGQ